MRYLFFALALSCVARGEQVLTGVKVSNCGAFACSRLITREAHRSTLNMNLMAFEDATLEITDLSGRRVLRTFSGRDGYIDLKDQVVVLRDLKKSPHKELIYNLAENKFIFL